MAKIEDILELERIEENIFRGIATETLLPRTFGGQVAGQALVSAVRTVVPEFQVHSLHGYFLRPGDPTKGIVYQVDRIRDGRSFCTRRVTAVQGGRAIFTMSASFHDDDRGLEHQDEMPTVPKPEELPDAKTLVEQGAKSSRGRCMSGRTGISDSCRRSTWLPTAGWPRTSGCGSARVQRFRTIRSSTCAPSPT